MSGPLLELSGVVKDYRGLRPLRISALTVVAGEKVALVGLDQVSAEVFTNLVTGATLPESGDVRLFGRSTRAIADGDDWLATVDRLGIVTARAVLLDQLSVVQNLAMPFTLDIEPPPTTAKAQAEDLAREVGLSESDWDRPIATLDAPSRVRLRLGRSLALNPAVLILEHATAGLSDGAAAQLGADVAAIAERRGAAVIGVTVDETFARAIAGRSLKWDPATGRLTDSHRRPWFRRSG